MSNSGCANAIDLAESGDTAMLRFSDTLARRTLDVLFAFAFGIPDHNEWKISDKKYFARYRPM